MEQRREYPRIITRFKVSFELVSWQELDLDKLEYPIEMNSYDLSVSGVRVEEGVEIGRGDLRRLMRGTRKIRLALDLPGVDSPLMTFARLIWSDHPELSEGRDEPLSEAEATRSDIQYGFRFIDVRAPVFDAVQSFVEKGLSNQT